MSKITLEDLIAERDKLNEMISQYENGVEEEDDYVLYDEKQNLTYRTSTVYLQDGDRYQKVIPSSTGNVTINYTINTDNSVKIDNSVTKISSYDTKLAGGDSAIGLISSLVTGLLNF